MSRSIAEVANLFGKEAEIPFHGTNILVVIHDYKQSYGRDRWQVTPVNGRGAVWVEIEDIEQYLVHPLS